MTPLEISFEVADTPQTVAHIRSSDGVLGHAQEMRDRIPRGTWLALTMEQARLGPWLTTKCGFRYMGTMLGASGPEDVLQKVED